MKLPTFWTRDSCSWFTLAESTFNRSGVADTRLRFDLVLPALPEEVIEQVRAILHAVDDIANPYRALKAKLLDLFTPKLLDLCQKIIHSGKLGNRRPSHLMEAMLALLPPGEPDGMLFKTHFLNRLPADIRNHVVGAGFNKTSRLWPTTSSSLPTAARAATSAARRWRQSRRMTRTWRRQ